MTDALPMKILLAVGSKRAIGLASTGDLVPEEAIVSAKSQDLMCGRMWSEMGQTPPEQ